MLQLLRPAIETAVRHGLTIGATALVGKGIADESTASLLIGGGMGVFALLWSLLNGVKATK